MQVGKVYGCGFAAQVHGMPLMVLFQRILSVTCEQMVMPIRQC